ncbi:hypothetical protein CSQ93_15565 [Janthinobacterium sp. BJB426]|nr:hypothetical protein CSQ93_15565 [Janthinobacterium sp. BJB426]
MLKTSLQLIRSLRCSMANGRGKKTSVLAYIQQQREWIIVTAGACVSVFSQHEPEIRDAVWRANA